MNAIKCPQCGNTNASNLNFCLMCGLALTNLPQSDYVSVSPIEQARLMGYGGQTPAFADTETGRKTKFWFNIYSGFMSLIYLAVVGLGVLLLFGASVSKGKDAAEMTIMGIVYGLIGLIFFLPFAIALFLPRKPWVWVYSLVLIIIGLMGCPTVFASVPLLIFWLKPETKAYFGRN